MTTTTKTASLKRAYRRTLEEQGGFDTDIAASRRAAVENVKNVINRRRQSNDIMAEWLNAKNETKKWSLSK
jgi:hypothetical protein